MKRAEDQLELLQVSDRLQAIAHYIPDKMRVADIGGDHAFLLLYVARQGRLQKGIVGEVNRGPFENARDRVALMGFSSLIDVRLGDGLSVLNTDEVDVVVIAGMGGALITQILEKGKEKLAGVKRLVLQPNIGGKRVRTWLYENQYEIVAETLVEDADILYEVIVAEPGNEKGYLQTELRMSQLLEIGPLLWRQRHPLLRQKLLEEQQRREKVFKQLERGKTEEAVKRKEVLEGEIKEWEKVIACLSAEQN